MVRQKQPRRHHKAGAKAGCARWAAADVYASNEAGHRQGELEKIDAKEIGFADHALKAHRLHELRGSKQHRLGGVAGCGRSHRPRGRRPEPLHAKPEPHGRFGRRRAALVELAASLLALCGTGFPAVRGLRGDVHIDQHHPSPVFCSRLGRYIGKFSVESSGQVNRISASPGSSFAKTHT